MCSDQFPNVHLDYSDDDWQCDDGIHPHGLACVKH